MDEMLDYYSDHIISFPSLSAFLQGGLDELGEKSLKQLTDEEKIHCSFK